MSCPDYASWLADENHFDHLDELRSLTTATSPTGPSPDRGSNPHRTASTPPLAVRAGLHLRGFAECHPLEPAAARVDGRLVCNACLHP